MIIKTYFRREEGKIYKYARVTRKPSKAGEKMLKRELDASIGWMLIEGYAIGNEKPRLQEIYRREMK